jgi:hypothetical protein
MSGYLKIATGEYYFYEGDIRLEHPNMGAYFVCPPEYVKVKETALPIYNDMIEDVVGTVEFVGGQWTQVWQVVQLSLEKITDLQVQRDKSFGIYSTDTSGSGSAPDVIK